MSRQVRPGAPPSPSDLAGHLGDQLRDLAGGDPVPHLTRLAGRLGVRSVTVSVNLSGLDGRTVFRTAGPDVELSAARRHEWRRVALAHELAHVLFRRHDLYLRQTRVRLDVGGIYEEQLCDAVAAALLVPANLAGGRLRLQQLLRVAATAQVPLPLVMRRLRMLGCQDAPLLTIRRGTRGWCAVQAEGWGGGTPVPLCGQASRTLDTLAERPAEAVSVIELPLPGDGLVALEAAWASIGVALYAVAASSGAGEVAAHATVLTPRLLWWHEPGLPSGVLARRAGVDGTMHYHHHLSRSTRDPDR